jgi:hypothetical protein
MPFFRFPAQKRVNALYFYEFQVFNQACTVSCSVSLIQLLQPSAWIIFTLIAKSGGCFCQQAAITDDALPDIFRFVFVHAPASLAMVFRPQIGQAGGAIHATGGNMGPVKTSLC